jgi:peptidoglycan/LPS O-acetylase OafA/YrhL
MLPAVFVNNMVGNLHKSHLWSIAVEMQFYVFSPYLLKKMLKLEKPMKVPLTILVLSTVLNFVLLSSVCPEGWSDSNVWNTVNIEDFSENEGHCSDKYHFTNYQLMITRATPYAFGMYAAYLHINDKNHDYLESKYSIFLEWLAFIAMFEISSIGCIPGWANLVL